MTNWDHIRDLYRTRVVCEHGVVTEEAGNTYPCPDCKDTTMTTKTKTPDLAALVNEEITLADAAAQIDERRKSIKAILDANLDFGTHDIAGHQVQKRRGAARISADKVAANHPYEQAPELYDVEPRINLDKVKHHLAPAELDGYKTESAPVLVVK